MLVMALGKAPLPPPPSDPLRPELLAARAVRARACARAGLMLTSCGVGCGMGATTHGCACVFCAERQSHRPGGRVLWQDDHVRR